MYVYDTRVRESIEIAPSPIDLSGLCLVAIDQGFGNSFSTQPVEWENRRLRFAQTSKVQEPNATFWSAPDGLNDDDLDKFWRFAKSSGYSSIIQTLIDKGCGERVLFVLATRYARFEIAHIEAKLKRASGYGERAFKALQKRCQQIAAQIEHLNHVKLPNGFTFVAGLREFGGPGQGGLYPISERFVSDMERLPSILKEYSDSLNLWPHPLYRKLLSDKRWKVRWLAMLCRYVRAVTSRAHYKEIASLVNVADEFRESSKTKRILQNKGVLDATDVRKAVANFRRRNPHEWSNIETPCLEMARRTEATPYKPSG